MMIPLSDTGKKISNGKPAKKPVFVKYELKGKKQETCNDEIWAGKNKKFRKRMEKAEFIWKK